MGILFWVDIESPVIESVVDGLILAVFSAPFIYYFLIKDISRKNDNLTKSLEKQKLAEDALIISEKELQIISKKLINSEEKQRKALAFELHDGIGQSIFAVKLGLENLLSNTKSLSVSEIEKKIIKEVEKLKNAAEETRRISVNLRPAMLEDLGLIATLKWFVREFRQLYPLKIIELDLSIKETDIPESLKVVIFRIVQESLTNIGKHSDAKNVTINLKTNDSIYLSIRDDGVGFSMQELKNEDGIGLSSMKERTKHSQGVLSIESRPTEGTIIKVEWA